MSSQTGSAGKVALFIGVFVAVFLAIVITTVTATFILPETFASSVRMLVDHSPGLTNYPSNPLQEESEIIQSEVVLTKVVEELDLNSKWGKKYTAGQPLKSVESLELLRKATRVTAIRGTRIVEVQVFSDQPDEAADLAGAIAQSYISFRGSASGQALPSTVPFRISIIEKAAPNRKPVRPNKPQNIALGSAIGTVLGVAAGIFAVSVFSGRSGGAASRD